MTQASHKFSKAWDNTIQQVIDIRDLPRSRNGKKCDCSCVDCKEPLEACQGFVNAWYFRHQTSTDCKGGPMTALHLMAQFLLVGNHKIQTRVQAVEYRNGTMEFKLPNSNFKIDIVGEQTDQGQFLIEIFVQHRIDNEKAEHIKREKLHCIEIDLSKVNPTISKQDLYELLINNVSLQKIIYAPDADDALTQQEKTSSAPEQKNVWYEDLLPIALLIGAIYGGYRIVKGVLQKKKRK
jgi:hypothetical protein